jgi:2-oxo-4-hydroxy-4-carboxy-5-ureidoimidazoline decarboxylase
VTTSTSCRLDALDETALREALFSCCTSAEWVRRLMASRPYGSDDAVLRAAEEAWSALQHADWLDAFEGAVVRDSPETDEGTGAAIAKAFDLFRERFGYPFVTAGPGTTGEELLMRIRIRLGLEAEAQMRASCTELRRVALSRLQQLLQAS